MIYFILSLTFLSLLLIFLFKKSQFKTFSNIVEKKLTKGFNIFSVDNTNYIKLVYGTPYSESTNYSKIFTLSYNKFQKYFEFEYKNINKTGFNKIEKFFINIFERINKYIPKRLKSNKYGLQDGNNCPPMPPVKKPKIILPSSYDDLDDSKYLTSEQKKLKSRQSFANLTETVEKIIAS